MRVAREYRDSPFDWQNVLRETFRVRCQRLKPFDAAVAVKCRGHWFCVDDADLDSKSIFGMLAQLMALQAGDVRATEPVLTLPVTR